jgi:hypothetical protein
MDITSISNNIFRHTCFCKSLSASVLKLVEDTLFEDPFGKSSLSPPVLYALCGFFVVRNISIT